MKVLTIRHVPDEVHAALTAVAARNGRSAQQQALLLLERVMLLDQVEPVERAAELRARLRGRRLGDSVAELREERER